MLVCASVPLLESSSKRARTSFSAPASPRSAFSSTPASSPTHVTRTADGTRHDTRKRAYPLTPAHTNSHALSHPHAVHASASMQSLGSPLSLSHPPSSPSSSDSILFLPYDDFCRLPYIDQLRFRALDECRLEWIDGVWMLVGREKQHNNTDEDGHMCCTRYGGVWVCVYVCVCICLCVRMCDCCAGLCALCCYCFVLCAWCVSCVGTRCCVMPF